MSATHSGICRHCDPGPHAAAVHASRVQPRTTVEAVNIQTEQALAAVCLSLIDRPGLLSAAETALLANAAQGLFPPDIGAIRAAILGGEDPLGDAFSALRSASSRRAAGAVYTPARIVQSMVSWLAAQGSPERIVDPGAGSGRFIIAAGAAFSDARLVAVEKDPLAALIL